MLELETFCISSPRSRASGYTADAVSNSPKPFALYIFKNYPPLPHTLGEGQILHLEMKLAEIHKRNDVSVLLIRRHQAAVPVQQRVSGG